MIGNYDGKLVLHVIGYCAVHRKRQAPQFLTKLT